MTNTVTVRRLMTTDLVTVGERESLDRAETLMEEHRIRHLPVVDGRRLVGLVTQRDLLRALRSSLSGGSKVLNETIKEVATVGEIMTTDIVTFSPDATMLEAAGTMRELKLGCIPVVEGGRIVGIMTEADFLDVVIQALMR